MPWRDFNKKHLLGVSATSFITVISGHCMSWGGGGVFMITSGLEWSVHICSRGDNK